MIIRTMELLFEYMALVLCIHKVAKKKVEVNIWMFLPFIIEWICVFLSTMGTISIVCKILVLGGIFLYTKIKLVETWKKAGNIFGIGILLVLSLQVLQYYLIEFLPQFLQLCIVKYEMILININICMLSFFWKEKYVNAIVVRLNKGMAIFLLMFIRVIYLASQSTYSGVKNTIYFFVETIGLSVACILWISTEKEKSHKAREVQMYTMYNQAFEEAIFTIRTRQHEFENHINAIKCMKYTIADQEELLLKQEQYCERVLKENKLNKLLKLEVEPVLIGFLYSKITSAEEKGISTEYEIQPIDIKEKIAIYEFIEVVGILFDNAVEALEKRESKKIILRISREEVNAFSLEIANCSPFYLNSEIEKFCSYGYSTKGENRGVGLSRVKDIVKKYNAKCLIQNCIYYEENYLSFKLNFI